MAIGKYPTTSGMGGSMSWNKNTHMMSVATGLTVVGVAVLLLVNVWWMMVTPNTTTPSGGLGQVTSLDGVHTMEVLSEKKIAIDGVNGEWDGWEDSYEDRLQSTLVIYVYNAEDEEQKRNFAFFLRYGIAEHQPSYKIIMTDGPQVQPFPRLPSLPDNAQYLRTSLCSTTWGAIDAVSKVLQIQDYKYFVVVDSHVRGPFIPSYVTRATGMHWTEAFTTRLSKTVKMVGSIVTCEGAPMDGNAAGEWRGNPYVVPYAWATDSDGLARLMAQKRIFRCHMNEWDSRYYSDSGAALTIFQSGWTIDTLMARYQGVDWRKPSSWQCNQRVPPDLEMHYDGISINPYETIFVPITASYAAAQWSFVEQADRYEKWLDMHLRSGESLKEVQNNAWISSHWKYKAQKLVSMNARGPMCFDFEYYLEQNPDVEKLRGDEMAIWEHFMLIGQFQARKHKFSCPLQVGNSYRIAYVLSRGARCFDHEYYAEQYRDLEKAGFLTREALFQHFAEFGQFEKRKVRFTCADTLSNLPEGFDNQKGHKRSSLIKGTAGTNGQDEVERRKAAIQRAAMLRQRGDANDPVQQALKGALVEEAAKDLFKHSQKNKN